MQTFLGKCRPFFGPVWSKKSEFGLFPQMQTIVGALFWGKKILGVNNFFGSRNFLGQKIFLVRNIFGSKTYLGQKKFWVKKNLKKQTKKLS